MEISRPSDNESKDRLLRSYHSRGKHFYLSVQVNRHKFAVKYKVTLQNTRFLQNHAPTHLSVKKAFVNSFAWKTYSSEWRINGWSTCYPAASFCNEKHVIECYFIFLRVSFQRDERFLLNRGTELKKKKKKRRTRQCRGKQTEENVAREAWIVVFFFFFDWILLI